MKEIKYLKHPVSVEEVKAARAAGFKVLDERFRPASDEVKDIDEDEKDGHCDIDEDDEYVGDIDEELTELDN